MEESQSRNPYRPPEVTGEVNSPVDVAEDELGCLSIVIAVGQFGIGVAFTFVAVTALPQIYMASSDPDVEVRSVLIDIGLRLCAGIMFASAGILIKRQRPVWSVVLTVAAVLTTSVLLGMLG